MLHLPKESNSGIKSTMLTQMSLAEIMFSYLFGKFYGTQHLAKQSNNSKKTANYYTQIR